MQPDTGATHQVGADDQNWAKNKGKKCKARHNTQGKDLQNKTGSDKLNPKPLILVSADSSLNPIPSDT